jgi:hypothetical protein
MFNLQPPRHISTLPFKPGWRSTIASSMPSSPPASSRGFASITGTCRKRWATKAAGPIAIARNAAVQHGAMCQDVWPGRAEQDGLPRPTNVSAATMYQASVVERHAPGQHGYPRASKTR